MTTKSDNLFRKAKTLMPGGVSSPVRAFGAVPGDPFFIASGRGSHIRDVDGCDLIDYCLAYGPLILGHANPRIVEAVRSQSEAGMSYGIPTRAELDLAEEIARVFPSMEMIRLVSSGTEAVMSALRLARAATGRNLVVKAAGGYHGHVDSLLVKAGSGAVTHGTPDSAGVSAATAAETLTVPYNDPGALSALLEDKGDDVAAVILEPVAGNMGCVPPAPGYLDEVGRLARDVGALYILDEIITGFRFHYGGAQQRFSVTPDLTTLGKIVGGGLPLACYGGRRCLMEMISPEGPVYQAGTLSGNPLATAAGLTTLEELRKDGVYERLEEVSEALEEGLRAAAEAAGLPIQLNRLGPMLTVFMAEEPVTDFASAKASDIEAFGRFHRSMLDAGIFLPPSQFESLFLSTAHTQEDIEKTITASETAFRAAREA